jgi:hypothetical protein
MFDLKLSPFLDESKKVVDAAHRATVSALRKTAYATLRDVQGSFEVVPMVRPDLKGKSPAQKKFLLRKAHSAAAAPVGSPPHSRRGLERRAERYDVDAEAESAVIGPRASVIGQAMQAQEFGGEYQGRKYPLRPSIGPALEREEHLLPTGFSGAVTE